MTENTIDQWMVRTATNEIRGPFSKEDVLTQIREGKIGAEDEVCQANHYWIYLDERDEVLKQLGVEVPRSTASDGEEITDTQTMTMTDNLSAEPAATDEIPELAESISEDSSVMANRALRRFQPKRFDRKNITRIENKPLVIGKGERPSFWRILVASLIVLIPLLVAWVIRVLQTSR